MASTATRRRVPGPGLRPALAAALAAAVLRPVAAIMGHCKPLDDSGDNAVCDVREASACCGERCEYCTTATCTDDVMCRWWRVEECDGEDCEPWDGEGHDEECEGEDCEEGVVAEIAAVAGPIAMVGGIFWVAFKFWKQRKQAREAQQDGPAQPTVFGGEGDDGPQRIRISANAAGQPPLAAVVQGSTGAVIVNAVVVSAPPVQGGVVVQAQPVN